MKWLLVISKCKLDKNCNKRLSKTKINNFKMALILTAVSSQT